MSQRTLLAVERTLISLAAGVLALMLVVNLVAAMSQWRISGLEIQLFRLLQQWLFPLQVGVIGGFAIGIPIGLVCGFLCGKVPPYYAMATALVLVAPFFIREPSDPTTYIPVVLVALMFALFSSLGARAKLRRGPAPTFTRPRALGASAMHIVSLDVGMLLTFALGVTCVQSIILHGSIETSAPSAVVVLVALPALSYFRSRVRLRDSTGVA